MPESKYLTHQRIAPMIGSAEVTAQRYHRAPAWCQFELDRLASLVHDALAKLSAGPADSNTFADSHGGPNAPARPLGKSPAIEHRFPDGQEATILWLEGPLVVPVVEVMASNARCVVEMGGATNVARIRLESR